MLLNELFSSIPEGINDPHIFKALFVIGAPGSGKSTLSKYLTDWTGLRRVNPDDFYELSLKKRGVGAVNLSPDIESDPDWNRSRELKTKKLNIAVDGRLGLVVDGTGRYAPAIVKAVQSLRSIGYDVAMIYIQVDVDTAIARQQRRDRRVDPEVVRSYHESINNNLPIFQKLFDSDGGNFVILNNSSDSPERVLNDPQYLITPSASGLTANRWFRRWLNKSVNNPAAAAWKNQERKEIAQSYASRKSQ